MSSILCSTCNHIFKTKYARYKHRKEGCQEPIETSSREPIEPSPREPSEPSPREPPPKPTKITFSPLQKKVLNLIKTDKEINALIKTIVDEAVEKKMKMKIPIKKKNTTPPPPLPETPPTNPLVDFLKIRCRNAIVYDKFMGDIEITETDLDTIAQKGFVDGITEVFKQKLETIDRYDRPFHCINKDSYDMYFRFEKNKWKKDTETNENLIQIVYDFSQQIDLAIVAFREVLRDDEKCDHWSRCARGGIDRPQKIQEICKNIADMLYVSIFTA